MLTALSAQGVIAIIFGFNIKTINTPHVPLGMEIEKALDILKTVNHEVVAEIEKDEKSHKVSTQEFEMAIYETDGKVSAVWYNDPVGRGVIFGKKKKISLYLQRYGLRKDWEKRMNNGWITFFFNDVAKVSMAYGNDMDVIRFNDNK